VSAYIGILYFFFLSAENKSSRVFFFYLPKTTTDRHRSRNSIYCIASEFIGVPKIFHSGTKWLVFWLVSTTGAVSSITRRLSTARTSFTTRYTYGSYPVGSYIYIYTYTITRISNFSHPAPAGNVETRAGGLIYCDQMEGMSRKKNRNQSPKKYRL